MNAKFLIGTVALIALGVIGVAFLQHPAAQVPSEAASAQTPIPTSSPAQTADSGAAQHMNTPSGYTLADVAQHNDASSCWAAISGKIYDLTNWINQHPGGPERILSICGTDATTAFNNQHGGQSRPEQELARFYLAPLAH